MPVPDIDTLLVFAAEEEGGSFLVSPGLGLMIWTLVLFLFTMWVLSRVAFPRIQEALDKRANAIREDIEAAERQRKEADELLAEYRQRLKEAREQADDIMERARKTGEAAKAEATSAGREKREELADLTVLATEKVARKSLDAEDQKRLVEEALAEVDFSSLGGNGTTEDKE
jgi:F-type H+-transporting ATPase subunit b